MAKKRGAIRPKRTKEHVIASQSQNYIEKFFIDKGHTATPLPHDYGTDLLVETFDINGHAENGFIRLQLKASAKPSYSKDRTFISFKIEVEHFELWVNEEFPVFLIIYDAVAIKAYYLYLQEYFASISQSTGKKSKGATVTVRIPFVNEFNEDTVDYMRDKKLAIQKQIKGKIKHES